MKATKIDGKLRYLYNLGGVSECPGLRDRLVLTWRMCCADRLLKFFNLFYLAIDRPHSQRALGSCCRTVLLMTRSTCPNLGPKFPTGSRFAILLVAALTLPFLAQAQDTEAPGSLDLTDRVAVPGARFSLFLTADLAVAASGVQVEIEYPDSAMEFVAVTTSDTVFSRTRLEEFSVTTRPGLVQVTAIEDLSEPIENFVSAGSSVRLLRLDFKLLLAVGLGDEHEVRLLSDRGTPPIAARIFSGEEALVPQSLGTGTVTVVSGDFLRIRDVDGVRVGKPTRVEFSVFNVQPLQGISIAIEFDPREIRFDGIDLDGTISEAFGAEFFAPVIENDRGYCTIGLLMDAVPPFDNQSIPATGFDTLVANADVMVLEAAPDATGVDLNLATVVGDPPVGNAFVVGFDSVVPETESGRLALLVERPFLRGDINDDGGVDISDAVWTLQWLFLGLHNPECQKAGDTNDTGKVLLDDVLLLLQYQFWGGITLPAPFPELGFDPTPDDLFCHYRASEVRN
jgi:hypothetical protein